MRAAQSSQKARVAAHAERIWGPGEYDVQQDRLEARVLRAGQVLYRASALEAGAMHLAVLEQHLGRRAAERSA